MRVGARVYCTVCGRQKCPRGRSASPCIPMCHPPFLCEGGCDGYHQEPRVGDLWPGETEEDFGYQVSSEGTMEVPND